MSTTNANLRGFATRCAVACVVFAGPWARARAAPNDGFAMSNDAALRGGTALVFGRDAASVWYNPASVAATPRFRFDAAATAYGLRITRARFVSTRDGEGVTSTDTDTDHTLARNVPGWLTPVTVATGIGVELRRGMLELDAEASPSKQGIGDLWRRHAVWNVRLGGSWQVAQRWALGGGLFTDRTTQPPGGVFPTVVLDRWPTSTSTSTSNADPGLTRLGSTRVPLTPRSRGASS